MAAFGHVTLLVASLLALLCSVVGAPMDLNNYFNRLAHPFDSISNEFHSNQPAEHESGFGWNDFDPPVDHRYGSQGLSEHNAMNTAAMNHGWQGGASRYSPYMISNNPAGGASSSRGGVGSSGQYTGYQHQPSASIGPGPGNYGAFEPQLQHQHLNSPGGEGSYDLDDLLPYTREQIDEMASIMNSPDVAPPPSALPHSQAVHVHPLIRAAEDAQRRKSESLQRGVRVRQHNKKAAIKAAERELLLKKQETIGDLKKYRLGGDPTSDPASALARLTNDQLHHHAKFAFRRESTALQARVQNSDGGHLSRDYVYSTEHQSAIVQELINRRPNVKPQRIRVTADPNFKAYPTSIRGSVQLRIDPNWAPRRKTPAYYEPFKMGEYEIFVIDTRQGLPAVYAIHAAALADFRGASSLGTGEEKPPSVFLGHISLTK